MLTSRAQNGYIADLLPGFGIKSKKAVIILLMPVNNLFNPPALPAGSEVVHLLWLS